jgi:DNA polymerase-3 subunit delta
MNAVDFLNAPEKYEIGPIAAVYGPERHLKRGVFAAILRRELGDNDPDLSMTRYAGKDADVKQVCDELSTVSMWGDKRLVLIEAADDFVAAHRQTLERYLDQPAQKSVLVLDLKSWPKNTRLAKLVAKIGLDVECKTLAGRELIRWLTTTAAEGYGKRLAADTAQLMVALAGADLGLLEQELGKLTSYVGERKSIDVQDVHALVGGWTSQTTFAMVAALREGNLGTALIHLDKLLGAGEAPQRILGGIAFVYRKLARATERSRHGVPLNQAMAQSGVFPGEIESSARYLRRIGRGRAEQLLRYVLETDANFKGGSQLTQRCQLEQLLVQLSGKI